MPYDDDNYTISAAPPPDRGRIIPYSTPGGGGGYMYADGSPVIAVNPDGTPTALGRSLFGLESPPGWGGFDWSSAPGVTPPELESRNKPNALIEPVLQRMRNSGNPGNPMFADQPGQHYLQASPVNQPQVEVVNVKPPMRLTSTQNPSAGVKQSAQPNAPMQTQSDFGGGDAQSGEPLVMPWDYHEDPIAWLNRRAAEMYRREEA